MRMNHSYEEPCSSSSRRVSLDHLWLCTPALIFFVVLCLTPLREGDLWWHLKLGELMVRNHRLPAIDTFTFTAQGLPVNSAHSWLSDVAFYLLGAYRGLASLVVLQAVIGSGIVALLAWAAFKRGAKPAVVGAVCLLACLALYATATARPQIFSFLCFTAIVLVLLERQTDRLWLLPLIMLFWCNVHGTGPVGLLFITAILLLRAVESLYHRESLISQAKLAGWTVVTLLVTLVFPIGTTSYQHIFASAANPIIRNFSGEWQPISLGNPLTWSFLAMLALYVLALARSRYRPKLDEFGVTVLFAFLGLRLLRMEPFFAILVTPFLSRALSEMKLRSGGADRREQPAFRSRSTRVQAAVNAILMTALVLGAILSLPQLRIKIFGLPETSLIDPYFPRGSADFLSRYSTKDIRLFNMAEWGGYLTWRLHPKALVFADGRVELFPITIWQDYLQIISAEDGWQDKLAAYHVDFLVLSTERHATLINAAFRSDWPCVFEEPGAFVFAHPGTLPQDTGSCQSLNAQQE